MSKLKSRCTSSDAYNAPSSNAVNPWGNSARLQIHVTDTSRLAFTISDNFKINFRIKSNGHVFARRLTIYNIYDPFPDYVFGKNYSLSTLDELARFIDNNGCLPGMPTAENVESYGMDIGHIQNKTVEKLEEAYLYILQQNDRIKDLEKKYEELSSKLSAIQK